MDSTFRCINCAHKGNKSQLFVWTKCNHKYCKKCASNVVNECLSLLNCIPVCQYPQCDQLLNIKHGNQIKSLLSPKYNFNADVKRFTVIEYLLFGYIRRQNRTLQNKIIPNEVSLLIYDYYNLIYVAKKACCSCLAVGYKFMQCSRCSGNGQYPSNCTQCHPSHPGIYKYTVNCHQCKGCGKKLIFERQCNKCHGNGTIVNNCRKCNESGIYRLRRQCSKCDGAGEWRKSGYCHACNGSGTYKIEKTCDRCNGEDSFRGRYGELITHCRKCNASGIYKKTGQCRKCQGSGQWQARGDCYGCNGRGMLAEQLCNQCNGAGKKIRNCFKCEASGTFRKFAKCRSCNGRKTFDKEKRCDRCGATGYVNTMCGNCDGGKIPYHCPACKTEKYFIMLDFNKLCNKQLLCHKCNEYCPANGIVYWSECCHVVCGPCICDYVQNEIKKNKIPICPAVHCKQELSMKNLKLINKYYNHQSIANGDHFEKELEVLFDRKDKFKCVNCGEWHGNCYLVQCACDSRHQFGIQCAVYWSNCNHSFCIQCMIPYISNKINNDIIPLCLIENCEQELLTKDMAQFTVKGINVYHLKHKLKILIGRKGKSQCSICHRWEFDLSLLCWPDCLHLYHKECAQQYIDNHLQTEQSVFNILKKESIPKCVTPNCHRLLTLIGARQFGLNHHQCKTLRKLINKQQNKSEDCIVM